MERKKKVSDRPSITWSNNHQRRLSEILIEALEKEYLVVRSDGGFRLSEEFFQQPNTRDFLAGIPRDMLEEIIAAWLQKQKWTGHL